MKIKNLYALAVILIAWTVMVPLGYGAETPDVTGNIYVGDVAENPAADKKGTVSLDFENADLKNVLKAFSMQTGINFIASDVIENKKITVFLSNVSIESALVSILEANDLLYEKQAGNVYLIKPTGKGNIKIVTKIYKLDYLQVYKLAEAAGATGSTSAISIIVPSSGGGTGTAPASTGTTATGQVKNIIEIVQSLMSKYGTIVADRRNNSLIISDIPDVFESIENTIKKLDIEPVQVVIQAQLVETTTSALKRIGLEYGSEAQLLKVTYTGSASTTGGASNSTNPTFPTAFPFTENFIKDVYNTNLAASGLFSYGTLRVGDVDIILKLLSTDTDTKFLARPKIMTINNEPAIIKVSANQAIGTNNTSVSTTGQSISTAERAETGVILKVTPQVNDKGDIFMFIEPSVSRVAQSTLSNSFLDPSYRTSASTVMIRDLETVVVAGLIQTNDTKTTRKIPILGDIPIIGESFRSRSKQLSDTELIIFVTPHIVKRRDAEYITPQELSDREYMLEQAMENYSQNIDKANNKNEKQLGISKDAAIRREEAMAKTLQRYSATPNTVQHK